MDGLRAPPGCPIPEPSTGLVHRVTNFYLPTPFTLSPSASWFESSKGEQESYLDFAAAGWEVQARIPLSITCPAQPESCSPGHVSLVSSCPSSEVIAATTPGPEPGLPGLHGPRRCRAVCYGTGHFSTPRVIHKRCQHRKAQSGGFLCPDQVPERQVAWPIAVEGLTSALPG